MAITTGTLILGAGYATVTYAIVGGIALMGAASIFGVGRQKMPKFGGSGLTNNIDPVADFEVIYGEIRKGGIKTYLETTNNNKYMHMIITLAGHEVNSIGDIYLNDEVVSFSGSDGTVTTSKWDSKVYIKKFTGSSTQNVYSTLNSLTYKPTEITSSFRGRGIACLYVRFEYDADTFANGVPLVTAKIQGKKLYDPRKDNTNSAYKSSLGVSTHRQNDPSSWQYSDEPALAVRDYLTSNLGLDAEQSKIDDEMISSAIDDCVSVGTSGSEENSFKIGGVVTTGSTPEQNINTLLTSLNGTLFYSQGEWKLLAGAYQTPDASVSGNNALGYDDIRGEISIATRFSRRDTVNTVRGTFIDGSSNGRFIETDYPQQQIPDLSEDNNEVSILDLELPVTTKSAAAQRIAKQILFVGREQITLSADFSLEKAFGIQVGDTIQLSLDRYGWSLKDFRVISWKMSGLDGSAPSVNLGLQETSTTAYQWSVTSDEYKQITHNNTNLGDATSGLSISGLATTLASSLQTDGTSMSRVILSWNAVSSPILRHYEVEWKPSSLSNYASTIAPNNAIEIEPLTAGTTYNFRVRAVTVRENVGAYATINATAVTDTTAPSTPSAPTVTAGVKQLEVSWQGYSFPSDFASMEIHHSTSSSGTYSLIGTSAGTSLVHSGLTQNTTHYYKLKAKDFSGNISGFSAVGNGTVLADAQGADGLSTFQATVYKRATSAQSAPSGGSFNFGTNVLTPPSTWSKSIPSGTDPIYACNFQFQIQGDTGSDTAGTWSTPYLYAENGTDGDDGLSTFVASVFKRSSSVITQAPTGGSYNFTTNTLTVPSGGWSDGVPSGSDPVYISNATASVSGPTGTDSSLTWSVPVKFAEDGATGPTGASGLIVTLNGAEIQTNNVDPQTATQAQLDAAFLAANPLLSQMSDVPEDAVVWARFVNPTFTNATSMSSGISYVIEVLGSTDFTAVGASRNLVGIEFIATGAGTGTGKVTTASARKWDYSSQNWSAHAQTFDSPAIFSPTVFALETFSQFIAATEIVSDKLKVNSEVNLEDGAAWKVGKSTYDEQTNGIFFGNPTGNLDFAFSTFGQDGSGDDHGVSFSDTQTRITNPIIEKDAVSTVSSANISSTQTIVIKSSTVNPNAVSLTVNSVGGGAGGAASVQTTSPTSGGRTRYRLVFNGTNQSYVNATGGIADAGTGVDKWRGDDGQDSAFASGGAGGGGENDTGDAGTLGSGGGGGAGNPPDWNQSSVKGGAGGGAGVHVTNTYDISSYSTVSMEITEIGNVTNTSEGNKGVGSRGDGGDGGDGVVKYTIETSGSEPVVLNTQLDLNAMFNASSTDGYFNHPSGMQLRWGTFVSDTDGDQTVTLTTAFSTNGLVGVVGAESLVKSVSRTNFVCNRDNGYGGSINMFYIMIGY